MAHQLQAFRFEITMWSCSFFIMSIALVMLGSGVSPSMFSWDHSVCQNCLPFSAGFL